MKKIFESALILTLGFSQAFPTQTVMAQTWKASEIWPLLDHKSADCSIKGETGSIGKIKYKKSDPLGNIKQIDKCYVVSSLVATKKGARGQFISVTDFRDVGVEGYLSYFLEVNCDDLESRMRYFWNLSSKKYKATSEMYYDQASRWWYFFRDDNWSEWEPITNMGMDEEFLCINRDKF